MVEGSTPSRRTTFLIQFHDIAAATPLMTGTMLCSSVPAMPQTCIDPDPYAELDNRADAFELSDELRKPIRIHRGHMPSSRMTQTRLSGPGRRIPV
jgi:hypothetical protein